MKVSIAKCDSYEKEEVYKAVKKSIDLIGGIEKFVKKGQKVLIKPNLLRASKSDKRITTDPAVLDAVIRLVKPITNKICVGDSPAIQSTSFTMNVAGLKEICDKHKVHIVEFCSCKDYKFKSGKKLKGFQLEKEVMESDVIINLPKFKTHVFMTYTGAVKNLYGCITGVTKAALHFTFPKREDFAMMLLDLYEFTKPKVKLNIIDAVIGMEGNGPSNGIPRKLGFISASEDALVLDKIMCDIAKIRSNDVPILKLNRNKLNKTKMHVLGDKINIEKIIYPKTKSFFDSAPLFFSRFIRNNIRSKPKVNVQRCIACRDCVKICPAKTIKIINRKAFIYIRKCIRCYCCHEVCPHNAIILKKPMLAKAYSVFKK